MASVRGSVRGVRRRDVLRSAGTGVLAGSVTGLAVGCGGAADPATQPGAVTAPPVELRVQSRQAGSGVSEVEYWEKVVGRFNERQRRARATFEAFPPDKGPVVLAVSGTLGDIVRLGGFGGQFPEMAVKGFLKDTAPLIQRDRYDLKQFHPASIETLKLRGKQFGLPHVSHPGFSGHYVNLDALAQAGVPEPNDATWTLTQLEDLARRLATSGRTGNDNKWVMWAPTQLQHVIVAARAYGGEVISKDGKRSLIAEPASVEALQWIADLLHRHRLAPPPGTLQGSAVNNFMQGNVAIAWWNMFIMGTLAQQAQGVRWKVLLAPKGPKERGIFMTTDPAAQHAGSAQPDQAFELLKHVLSKESNFAWFDMTGNPGGRVDFWTDKRVTDDPATTVFGRAIAESQPLHHVDNGTGDEHNRVVTQELNAIWSGKAGVRDAADAARRAAQEVMDRPSG